MAHVLDFDWYVQNRENRIVRTTQVQSWMCLPGNLESSEPKSILQLLRTCSRQAKVALGPVLRLQNCKVVESLLCDVREESQLLGVAFNDLIETPDVIERLLRVVDVFSQEGVAGVERLFSSLLIAKTNLLLRESRQHSKDDTDVYSSVLNAALEANQRGLLELERSFAHEALVCFRYAISIVEAIQRHGIAVTSSQNRQEIHTLHMAILKNASQTAVHLHLWNEAADFATQAVHGQEDDAMAWLCKADAMSGFANSEEVVHCLRRAEDIAIDHQECDSIQHEILKRRQKLENLESAFSPGLERHSPNNASPNFQIPEKSRSAEISGEPKTNDHQHEEYQLFAAQVWRGWRHFEVLGEVLPMQVGEVGAHGEGIEDVDVTPQDITRIWEERWHLNYIGRIRFQAPEGSAMKWLNHRNDLVPPYPAVTRLVVQSFTNYQSILTNLKLALLNHSKNAPKIVQFVHRTLTAADLERKQKSQELATLLAKAPCAKNMSDVRTCLKRQ